MPREDQKQKPRKTNIYKEVTGEWLKDVSLSDNKISVSQKVPEEQPANRVKCYRARE